MLAIVAQGGVAVNRQLDRDPVVDAGVTRPHDEGNTINSMTDHRSGPRSRGGSSTGTTSCDARAMSYGEEVTCIATVRLLALVHPGA